MQPKKASPPADRFDKLTLVFNEARTELDSTIGAIDQITSKAFTLLSICIPIIAALAAYCVLQFNPLSAPFWATLASLLPLILCSFALAYVVLVVPMYHSGREPGDWFNAKVMSAPLEKIYADEINNYGDYITDNRKTLRRKGLGLKLGMGLFVASPLPGLGILGTTGTLHLLLLAHDPAILLLRLLAVLGRMG